MPFLLIVQSLTSSNINKLVLVCVCLSCSTVSPLMVVDIHLRLYTSCGIVELCVVSPDVVESVLSCDGGNI